MANGKTLQALKDKLDDKGCTYGQFTKKDCDKNTIDINEIGKKMGRVYWIAITVLLGLIANLILILSKK